MIIRIYILFLLSVALNLTGAYAQTETSPARIAVWDPVFGVNSETSVLDVELLTTIAEQMEQAGLKVERLRVDQLGNPNVFSAKTLDVFVLAGDVYPMTGAYSIQRFIKEGGTILAVASELPMTCPLVPDVNGKWQVMPGFSPQKPRPDMLKPYGLEPFRYTTSTNSFQSSAVLSQYVEGAAGLTLEEAKTVVMPRSGPEGNVRILPLLYSGTKGTMQPSPLAVFEYTTRGQKRHLINVNWDVFVRNSDQTGWPNAPKIIPALAKLGADLKHKRFRLDAQPELLDVNAIRAARKKAQP